ncbi:MAG: SUMF1/EgtB/PvdO family nonheme iron enzyme, partial [Candidatus Vecturithrix sp.]|nr:SUMF1/EgtB/PvdO family nonheme iron enzyme [Candidatus Vecturithrix sp.]
SQEAACLHLSANYTALQTLGTEKQDKADSLMKSPQEREHRGAALARLNTHQRLVLLGDPGSGKSTFVNFVALCLAGEWLGDAHANLSLLTTPLPKDDGEDEEQPQPWDHETILPVRVVLRDLAASSLPPAGQQATVNHFWEFLGQELEKARLQDYSGYLETHLREQGGLILFDGLDEVPEASQRRAQIKQMVEDVTQKFPRCRVVVTSRIYAYQQQDWRLSGFAEAVLAPFTPGQIRRFIDRWYTHSAELRHKNIENALGQAKLLKQAIFQRKSLQKLAERPLLLTLMASLHYWRGGSLPEKREELYADAVDLLLDWWESPKIVRDAHGQMMIAQESLSELLNVGREPVRKALETLAFQAHTTQTELTGTADISEVDLVQQLLDVSQNENLRPKQLLKYLSQRAGLLDARGVKVYTFPHRTFQEYLAACYLTNQNEYPDNAAELTRRDPNRWREVLLLAGAKAARGTVSSVWGLADALCYNEFSSQTDSGLTGQPTPGPSLRQAQGNAQEGNEDAWGALLAGQALVETADLQKISPRNQVKVNRIRDWLAAILTEQTPAHFPLPAVERALAGNILAHLGDQRPGVGLREDGLPEVAWREVPAGEFMMGSTPEEAKKSFLPEREQPRHPVYVSTFHISRYPVTNAQYRAFIEDDGYAAKWQQCWSEEGWAWKEKKEITEPDWVGGEFDLDNHPVVRVSWYEVSAFCQWLTIQLRERGELSDHDVVRLPTEAEWEKAARGKDGRIYPWGNDIDPEYANYDETGLGVTSTVGGFPRGVSPYGCEDMAGNVWEWCLDWYGSDYYANSPKENPRGPDSGSYRVDRGGDWGNIAEDCRAAVRNGVAPGVRADNLGFRLVRTPS